MENLVLNKNDSAITEHLSGSPYFIEIEKPGKKKIKIPCSNEKIARKILDMVNEPHKSHKVSMHKV